MLKNVSYSAQAESKKMLQSVVDSGLIIINES